MYLTAPFSLRNRLHCHPDNDSEMLAEAGLGVAVLNATERCKEAADLVIGDYLDDSVADFLEKMVL